MKIKKLPPPDREDRENTRILHQEGVYSGERIEAKGFNTNRVMYAVGLLDADNKLVSWAMEFSGEDARIRANDRAGVKGLTEVMELVKVGDLPEFLNEKANIS